VFDSRQGQEIFLYSTLSIPALGPIPLSNQWVPRALSPDLKRPGRQADESLLSSAEVKNSGAILSLLHVFMAWCLIN
jgi:hypothetical protein